MGKKISAESIKVITIFCLAQKTKKCYPLLLAFVKALSLPDANLNTDIA